MNRRAYNEMADLLATRIGQIVKEFMNEARSAMPHLPEAYDIGVKTLVVESASALNVRLRVTIGKAEAVLQRDLPVDTNGAWQRRGKSDERFMNAMFELAQDVVIDVSKIFHQLHVQP